MNRLRVGLLTPGLLCLSAAVLPAAPVAVPSTGTAAIVRAAAADSVDRAAETLARASERYEEIDALCATFEQERIVPLLDQTTRSRGTLCQMDPGFFLMDFSEPEGDRIVADGSDLWIYYPSMDEDQVIRTRLGAPGTTFDFHREFLDEPTRRFEARYLERATLDDGTETDVISLRPRERAGYEVARVWLEVDRGLIRKVEIEEENESVRRVVLSDIRLDPGLSPERFRFDLPEGVRVLDQNRSSLPR